VEDGRCQGTTREGKPCSAKALPDGSFCPWHDAGYAERRRGWSSEGGKARSNASRAKRAIPDGVMTALQLQGFLGCVIKDVVAGKTEAGVGNAVANLARAYAGLFGPATVEERLAALERDDRGTA
jgi:hypothetical protein